MKRWNRNRKNTIKLKDITLFVFVLGTFFNAYICFQWKTYFNGIYVMPTKLFPYLGLAAGMLYIAKRCKKNCSFLDICVLGIAIFFVFQISCLGAQYQKYFTISYVSMIIYIFVLLLLTGDEKTKAFNYLTNIFIIFTLPSIIYFILHSIGIDIPCTKLLSEHPGKSDMYYLHYPLGLLIDDGKRIRPCGIFDEPGYIGSIAGLLLASMVSKDGFKRKTFVVLIIGMLSTSLAFYIMLLLITVLRLYRKGVIKLSLGIIFLFIGYVLFINITFSNPVVQNIQERFQVINGRWKGNNRTSSDFEIAFNEFINGEKYPVWFGNGISASRNNERIMGGASYKNIIYDYGIIGVGLLCMLFLLILRRFTTLSKAYIFYIIFMASVYQRPYIFTPFYVVLFGCALANCNLYREKKYFIKNHE